MVEWIEDDEMAGVEAEAGVTDVVGVEAMVGVDEMVGDKEVKAVVVGVKGTTKSRSW